MKKIVWLLCSLWAAQSAMAQTTFPVNGVADERHGSYAFTNATIVTDGQTTLKNAVLLIKDGKIVSLGTSIPVPKDALVIDCKEKYIYPSFIDAYSDYGIVSGPAVPRTFNFNAPAQLTSNRKGPYGWNQAIKSDVDAYSIFNVDDAKAKPLRDAGFGTVLSHQKDGIARGTGTIVTLADKNENLVVLKEKASAHYSLSKGTSTQSYPSSLMGVIALLRQTYLDAQWYKSNPSGEGKNATLQAWIDEQSLPQIFDANDKWNDLRADKIGDEFGVQYIIKGGGNEYQRISDIVATKAPFIITLNFPEAMDVEDPNDARFVSLADMKHWELAPTNPGALEKANVTFCISAADLRDTKTFMTNLRKAITYGLSENKAFEALTKAPATLLGIYDKTGSLEAGKLANFIITDGPVFGEKTNILQNWVQGEKYDVKADMWSEPKGTYNLAVKQGTTPANFTLLIKSASSASILARDTIPVKITNDGKLVKMSFTLGGRRSKAGPFRLSGVINGDTWAGNGVDSAGHPLLWTATFAKPIADSTMTARDSARSKKPMDLGKITYPFNGYGFETMPAQEDLLIKNATVWTNEKDGHMANTDVLVKNGKIAKIGSNLSSAGAKVIDATGKYLTPGIIDEHSHIAAASINEGAQSVTSEVRIADNLEPEDIDIYRQLSGGVTSSHILHGSANTIGGQTQLIKLRWGVNPEELKFAGADGFIKFALGENVKRTTSSNNNRFPDTRMGVEEVLNDAFARAVDYQNEMKANPKGYRRDLELDALVEILNRKRFITCHSYVQSEITAAMRVGDKYHFPFNTFTHILEGYKVADKMKVHGANASTFSDWWGYKMEVQDAIPYNAAIMTKVGLNVCINSDDAEMARRLNQEAAKSVRNGGLTEDQAFNMVTINPAIALHVQDKVGSIKVGKDADLVVWSDNPLSIYAKAEKTIVDGIVYFDRERDMELRKKIAAERNRLIQKMLGEKRGGAPTRMPVPSMHVLQNCGDHEHKHGLNITEADEELDIVDVTSESTN